MPRFDVDVQKSGPLFDGRARLAVRQFVKAAEEEIAEVGARQVRQQLGRVLRQPTGYYQSNIHAVQSSGSWEVNDNGVVYGPWLEGTGSRNRTTRFKGYHTFRLVSQNVDRQSSRIAETVLTRYLPRMQ